MRKYIRQRCGRCGTTSQRLNPEWLRDIREKEEMSLRKFAELSGFSPAYISDLETGKRNVTKRVERAYRKFLDLT